MLDAVQWLTEPANMRMRQKLRHKRENDLEYRY